MKIKYIALGCIIPVLSLFLSINCLALTLHEQIDGDVHAEGELREIRSAMESGAMEGLPLAGSLDYDGAYKVYSLTNPDIVAEYKETGSVAKLIGAAYK